MPYQSPRRNMLLKALIHEATETDHALIDQAFVNSLGISPPECVDLRYLVADILRVFVSLPPTAQVDFLKQAQTAKLVERLMEVGRAHGFDTSSLEQMNSDEAYLAAREELLGRQNDDKNKNTPNN